MPHAPPPDAPLAITGKVRNAVRLVALDEQAEQKGLTTGQTLTDARAMVPALEAVDEEPDAMARLLSTIADWAERYTPLVALAGSDSLMLDITGCAHLFGGEEAILADMVTRFTAQGFTVRAATAATPGAAHALSRFHAKPAFALAGDRLNEALGPLPLSALRLEPETVGALDRVGLKVIHQISERPRGPLAARFGTQLIRRLDQALGTEEEVIGPRRPVPAFIAERRFAEPIVQQDDVALALSALAESLSETLEKHGRGARQLEYTLFRVDGAVSRIAVGASRPVRTPRLILDLFREKFAALGDALDAGYGFDAARLSVHVHAASAPSQIGFDGDAAGDDDLNRLVDRIGARLGPESVNRPATRQSHIPERAVANESWGVQPQGHAALLVAEDAAPGPVDRPLRLFSRPEEIEAVAEVPDGPPIRFRWRRVLFRVARAEGPERIAAEWWRADGPTRDYFRVEDPEGHRFWLYREGLYGRETSAPRWFLHGVFA